MTNKQNTNKCVSQAKKQVGERQANRQSRQQTNSLRTIIGFFFLYFFFTLFTLLLCLTRCTTGVKTMLLATGEKTFFSSSKSTRLECLVLRVCRFGVLSSRVATVNNFPPWFFLDLLRFGSACFFRLCNHCRILASQIESALSSVACKQSNNQ